MKRINRWTFVIVMAMIGWACEEKENMDPVGQWELHAPTASLPADNVTVALDAIKPDSSMRFEWTPATASNRFGISHTFMLIPEGSDDFDHPILEIASEEGFVALTAAEIDYALWAACYPAGTTADLQWAVVARAIEKEAVATQNISIKRFNDEYMPQTLFVYGSGTEAGEAVANATPMRPIPDADGNPSGVFEAYTTLTAGGTFTFRDKATLESRPYGGADGVLEACSAEIAAPETGQYRVTVDLNDNTYELLRIDRWSLVGDAVEGGWGGDVPLAYKGNGVWGGEVEFLSQSGFVFRANGDWGYLLKLIKGTLAANNKSGELFMESQASGSGIAVEDIPGALGLHTVTLTLAADGYRYSLVEVEQEPPAKTVIGETDNPDTDAVAGFVDMADYATPDALFLLSNDGVLAEFTKEGDVFNSGKYIALEAGKNYTLNTASDGSGAEIIDGGVSVARDQAYTLKIDFANGKLSWKYYNMKLFHWDEVGGGWDARSEFPMTYVHPYTFEVTADLQAGFDSKFNSPWDIQFGTNNTALTGTMQNGGPNFKGIVANGKYKATIVVSDDYSTAEYSFVKQ